MTRDSDRFAVSALNNVPFWSGTVAMAKFPQPYRGTYHPEKSGTTARKYLRRSRIMRYGHALLGSISDCLLGSVPYHIIY
jgi:hypothetical protein